MQRRRRRITWREEALGDEEEDVAAELKCPVCLEFLIRPTILPCSHILCRSPCAERIFRSGFVRCPVCRDDSYVSGGIDSLPRVITLERIIERYSNRNVSSSSSSSSSSSYEVAIAGVGDVACQLCSYVVSEHKNKTNSSNNVNNIDDAEEDDDEDIGPAVKAYKFCRHCRVAYCKPCLKTSHPDHPPFQSHQLVKPRKKAMLQATESQMNACLKHKKEAKKQEDNDKNDDENDGEEEEDEDDDAELYCMSCKEFLCKWCWLELQEETFGVNGGVGGGVDGGGVDGNGGVDGGVSGNGVVEGGGGVVGGGVDGGGVDGNGGVDGGVSGSGVVEGGGGVVGGGVDGVSVDGGGVDGGGANSRVVASSSGVQQKSVVDELQEGHSDNKASKSISHHRHHDVIPLNEAATIFMVKLKTQLESLQDCFDSSNKQQQLLRSCMTSLQKDMNDRKSKILNECDNLVNEVETKRQFFMSDLQFEERSKLTQMGDIMERGKERVAGLERQLEQVKRLLEHPITRNFVQETVVLLEQSSQCFQAAVVDEDPALSSLLASIMTPVATKVIDLRKERAVLRDVNYLTSPSTPVIDVASCFRSTTSVVLSLHRLSWEDVVVDGYVIFYNQTNSSKPDTWPRVTFSTPSETRLVGRGSMKEGAICLMHDNLLCDTMYYFAVSAFNGCGSSEISEVVHCSTLSQSQTFVNAPSILAERCRTFTYSAQLRTSIPLDEPELNSRIQIEMNNEKIEANINNNNNNNNDDNINNTTNNDIIPFQNDPLPVLERTNIYTVSTFKAPAHNTSAASQEFLSTTTPTPPTSSTSTPPISSTSTPSTSLTSTPPTSTTFTPPHIATSAPTTLINTPTTTFAAPSNNPLTTHQTTTSKTPLTTRQTTTLTNAASAQHSKSSRGPTTFPTHHAITYYLLYREGTGNNKIWKSVTLYGKFDHRVFGLEPNTQYQMVIMSCDVVNRRCHVSNKVTLTTERSAY